MTRLIPATILLFFLAARAATAADMYGFPDGTPGGAPQSETLGSLLQTVQTASRGASPWDRILRTVFVVPGPDLTPEGMAEISEDLAIMCRILDKTAVWADRMAGGEVGIGLPIDVSGIEISDHWIGTQGLYLDGHGAIFFLPVSFPLSRPSQEQAASKTEPARDPLWSQTADELRGVPQQSARPSSQQYDAQKVENLKTALIGTLRHAANLRTRRLEDVITIVVASRAKQPAMEELLGQLYGSDYGAMMSGGSAASAAELPTVLILRTTRSDVDALGKGTLSQEQFAGKVQFLKSWTSPVTETVPVGVIRPTVPVPSQNRW
jgi:hypothetical protein